MAKSNGGCPLFNNENEATPYADVKTKNIEKNVSISLS
jgi:hypothetical protein